jgi:hypothetical protein
LTVKKSNLEKYRAKYSHEIQEPYCINIMEHNLPLTIYHVIQNLQSKKFWTPYNLDVMALNYTQISAPALVINLIYELIYLTHNIFTMNEIQAITVETE